jgi:hypothetical protein
LTAIATATFVRRNASGPLPEMQVDITTLHGRPDGRHIRWKGAKTIPFRCAISDAHFEHRTAGCRKEYVVRNGRFLMNTFVEQNAAPITLVLNAVTPKD